MRNQFEVVFVVVVEVVVEVVVVAAVVESISNAFDVQTLQVSVSSTTNK